MKLITALLTSILSFSAIAQDNTVLKVYELCTNNSEESKRFCTALAIGFKLGYSAGTVITTLQYSDGKKAREIKAIIANCGQNIDGEQLAKEFVDVLEKDFSLRNSGVDFVFTKAWFNLCKE